MVTPADRDHLRRLHAATTQGRWTMQDGCSWRRIGAQGDGDVLHPTVARDGHPDLGGANRDENLAFIVAAHAAIPALLDRLDELERRNVPIADLDDALRQIGEMLEGDGAQAIQTVRDLLVSIAAHPRGSIVPVVDGQRVTAESLREPIPVAGIEDDLAALWRPPAKPSTGSNVIGAAQVARLTGIPEEQIRSIEVLPGRTGLHVTYTAPNPFAGAFVSSERDD